MWGCEFKLTKADPYPIKTYVDYRLHEGGLLENPKEHKIDPITPTLEYMGSIGDGEQVWLQILIRVNRKEKKKTGSFFKKMDWKGEGEELVDKLLKRNSKTYSL